MSKFGDYLRSLGTSEENIKLLDTPDANAAYDRMVADADARVAAEKKRLDDYQVQVDDYYKKTTATAKELENQAIVAKANEARARQALLTAQERGLVDVAKDLGYTPDDPNAKKKDEPKYLQFDDIAPALNNAGDGLATLVDIAREHERLFPDIPFSARELRNEQIKTGKSFEQYWMDKFNVPAARQAAVKARQDAHDKQIADAARAEERALLASQYGNPMTRPAVASSAPFVIKRAQDGKPEVPWARSENELSDARVRKATENFIKRGEAVTH